MTEHVEVSQGSRSGPTNMQNNRSGTVWQARDRTVYHLAIVAPNKFEPPEVSSQAWTVTRSRPKRLIRNRVRMRGMHAQLVTASYQSENL